VPEVNAAELWAAIREYARYRPDWDTPKGARNQCVNASAAFADFLLGRRILKIQDRGRFWAVESLGVVHGSFHSVLVVGDYAADWTARQFWAEAPYPLVWKLFNNRNDLHVYDGKPYVPLPDPDPGLQDGPEAPDGHHQAPGGDAGQGGARRGHELG
jgi:hypothetical protein